VETGRDYRQNFKKPLIKDYLLAVYWINNNGLTSLENISILLISLIFSYTNIRHFVTDMEQLKKIKKISDKTGITAKIKYRRKGQL